MNKKHNSPLLHITSEHTDYIKKLINGKTSTEAYIPKLNEIYKNISELIIAHTYTRFLADLFGGRTFFSILSSEYKISPEGLNYYKFNKIEDFKTYVGEYHGKLNSLTLSEEMQKEFLNEIYNAYIYNLAISNELDCKLNN